MENEIENLIEQLTKVRPEMLNEEALKLFNTIMAVLDERDKLIKENKELKENECNATNCFNKFVAKSKTKEKIEPVIDSLEKNGFVGYGDELRDIIDELMEDK